ncbi:hypothetical protein CHS0354_013148 [Potamilus streckersoni]|uniref:Uncharacterized protein n=1 Tax=Potamilus streckersoni TaxID=2493646 RepID=A0AAE0VPW1_9BIVA|nr:hypothetical protein CHS0354_013148 [Potamilus streckersoni]
MYGYILDKANARMWKPLRKTWRRIKTALKNLSVPDKVCLCTHMKTYKLWTCGHNVYRLKETTNKLSDGEFQLPSALHIMDDYINCTDYEVRRPALPPEVANTDEKKSRHVILIFHRIHLLFLLLNMQDFDIRPWGNYLVLSDKPGYKVKRITVSPADGLVSSGIKKRQEHWYVIEGAGQVTLGKSKFRYPRRQRGYSSGSDLAGVPEIRRLMHEEGIAVPLVADIHFAPHLAVDACEFFEKIRINPGNFSDRPKNSSERSKQHFDIEEGREKLRERIRKLVPALKKI